MTYSYMLLTWMSLRSILLCEKASNRKYMQYNYVKYIKH